MPNIPETSLLTLTTEEAMGLLEVCLMSDLEFDPVQHEALMKLSAFCREAYHNCRQKERITTATESNSFLRPVLVVA